MALIPNDPQHKMQIEAGTVGRKRGHKFEATLSSAINAMNNKHFCSTNKYVLTFSSEIQPHYYCNTLRMIPDWKY